MAINPADHPPEPEHLEVDLAQVLAHGRGEVHRTRQVFTNRNLRMGRIEMVGFDMDYTLAIYQKRSIEKLSFDMTLERLIRQRGYPELVARSRYDHAFVLRGLAVDRATGNLLKMDRYRHVGRAYHGRRRLGSDEKRAVYRNEKVSFKGERFAWIDTLFALPEACLYAEIIELLEADGRTLDFDKLYLDIRECIDEVHRDDSLKSRIRADLAHFVVRDPELGPALHKLRSAGKRLFLLTNSAWDYTDVVMRFLLDGCLPEYPSWRNYFDVVTCASLKPSFFADGRPFVEVAPETGAVLGEARALERGRVYAGGNLSDFERLTGIAGDRILYVGDHIYGDILRSKKSSLWRTCLVIEELEDEVAYTDRRAPEISRLASLDHLRARLDDEVNGRKAALNALERRLEREELGDGARAALEVERRSEKAALEKLRRALRETLVEADALEEDLESGFNGCWGLLFKEGTEFSRFGEQVEQYACLYTSRVSNLLHYSPMQYFRSPRDFMPHERSAPRGPADYGGVPDDQNLLGDELLSTQRNPRGNRHPALVHFGEVGHLLAGPGPTRGPDAPRGRLVAPERERDDLRRPLRGELLLLYLLAPALDQVAQLEGARGADGLVRRELRDEGPVVLRAFDGELAALAPPGVEVAPGAIAADRVAAGLEDRRRREPLDAPHVFGGERAGPGGNERGGEGGLLEALRRGGEEPGHAEADELAPQAQRHELGPAGLGRGRALLVAKRLDQALNRAGERGSISGPVMRACHRELRVREERELELPCLGGRIAGEVERVDEEQGVAPDGPKVHRGDGADVDLLAQLLRHAADVVGRVQPRAVQAAANALVRVGRQRQLDHGGPARRHVPSDGGGGEGPGAVAPVGRCGLAFRGLRLALEQSADRTERRGVDPPAHAHSGGLGRGLESSAYRRSQRARPRARRPWPWSLGGSVRRRP